MIPLENVATVWLSRFGPAYTLINKRVDPQRPVGGYVYYDVEGHPELTVCRIENAIPEFHLDGRRVNNAYLFRCGEAAQTCLVLLPGESQELELDCSKESSSADSTVEKF